MTIVADVSGGLLVGYSSIFVSTKHRLGHPEICLFVLWDLIFTGEKYPKNVLFDFENKIIVSIVKVYSMTRLCADGKQCEARVPLQRARQCVCSKNKATGEQAEWQGRREHLAGEDGQQHPQETLTSN